MKNNTEFDSFQICFYIYIAETKSGGITHVKVDLWSWKENPSRGLVLNNLVYKFEKNPTVFVWVETPVRPPVRTYNPSIMKT